MNNIDSLLEKYFDGDSSIEEERTLMAYFQQNNIDSKHKLYSPLFSYLSAAKKDITQKNMKPLIVVKNRLYTLWLPIAACIAVLIVALSISQYIMLDNTKSMVYIDGKKTSDMNIINTETLNALFSIESIDDNILESQIDILEDLID